MGALFLVFQDFDDGPMGRRFVAEAIFDDELEAFRYANSRAAKCKVALVELGRSFRDQVMPPYHGRPIETL